MNYNKLSIFLVKSMCLVVFVESFSFNIKARKTFRPQPGMSNDHSYFGYSLLLRDGDEPMIIVGAPQDALFNEKHKEIKDRGAIYYCRISAKDADETCMQRILDSKGNDHKKAINNKSYHNYKSHMWLGMSMDGTTFNNESVIMCAPRWINQLNDDNYFMNGMCYSVKNSLKSTDNENGIPIIPLVNSEKQVLNDEKYNYAFGQAGISTKLSNDAKELLLGAPGVFNWKGTVIKCMHNDEKHMCKPAIIPNPNNTNFDDDGYFGYSVGFGNFALNKPILYVAGAPRGSDLEGNVMIHCNKFYNMPFNNDSGLIVVVFDFPSRSDGEYKILAKLKGEQMGEYFGSVIATVDINQDGLTDLLIGAPMHSHSLMWNQGRVYVYMNQGNFQFKKQNINIGGCFQSGSHFGSAISVIGDINYDGFTDVAIGSPYEDNGKGAVYIYLGSKDGLRSNYTQRIVIDGTEGFGISISKGVDIDKNTCNDIAVGAYLSGNVMLLRCHPSIRIVPKIKTSPFKLLMNATSFDIELCVNFIGRESLTIDIETHLYTDLNCSKAGIECGIYKTFKFRGNGGDEKCINDTIDIESKVTDFSKPINLILQYNLINDPMEEIKFCEGCAVLDLSEKNELTYLVPFVNECTHIICKPDLRLHVDLSVESPYIIGTSKTIDVNVSLENLGDPAYNTKLKMIIHKNLPLLKIPSSCILAKDDELVCNLGNPFPANQKLHLTIEFSTNSLTSLDELAIFNITASSEGNEITQENNVFSYRLALKASHKIILLGSGDGNQNIDIKKGMESKDNVSTTHNYNILNYGPTVLDSFTMIFYVPIDFYDFGTKSKYNLINKNTISIYQNGNARNCKNDLISRKDINDIDLFISAMEYTTRIMDPLIHVQDDFVFKFDYLNSLNIDYYNCSNEYIVTCMRIQCDNRNLNVDDIGIDFSIKMKVDTKNFEKLLKYKHVAILSTNAVMKSLHKIKSIQKLYGYVNTYIFDIKLLPTLVSSWIYILGIILGIVILTSIIYILYKMGFFKRKTVEELQHLNPSESLNYMTRENEENITQ